jgi:hypothetical protein
VLLFFYTKSPVHEAEHLTERRLSGHCVSNIVHRVGLELLIKIPGKKLSGGNVISHQHSSGLSGELTITVFKTRFT